MAEVDAPLERLRDRPHPGAVRLMLASRPRRVQPDEEVVDLVRVTMREALQRPAERLDVGEERGVARSGESAATPLAHHLAGRGVDETRVGDGRELGGDLEQKLAERGRFEELHVLAKLEDEIGIGTSARHAEGVAHPRGRNQRNAWRPGGRRAGDGRRHAPPIVRQASR